MHQHFYDPKDVALITFQLERRNIDTFLIDRDKHPEAFEGCSIKLVADCTIEYLQNALEDSGFFCDFVNEDHVAVRGPEHHSRVFIDALTSISPLDIKGELYDGFKEGWTADWLRGCQECGLLEVLIPELHDAVGVEGGENHAETVFEHLLATLEAVEPHESNRFKLTALIHDIGKPATCKTEKDIRTGKVKTTFYKHEVVGAKIANDFCLKLGIGKQDTEYITNMVRHHMWRFEDETTDKALRRWLLDVGPEWEDLMRLRRADRKGNFAKRNRSEWPLKLEQSHARLLEVVKNNLIVFRNQLAVPEDELKFLLDRKKANHDLFFSNIVSLLNTIPANNTRSWILDYIERNY